MQRNMANNRKTKLVDCNPQWIDNGKWTGQSEGVKCGVSFDCPEGHPECSLSIPFTPSLDGRDVKTWQINGSIWQRFGDTFETLTLMPSIRRIPVTGRDTCALHVFVKDGQIEFCVDSK
jgi:hypothetical protein